jgi:hypothetical protein
MSLGLADGTVNVSLLVDVPAKINLTASPVSILSDGISTAVITAKVVDANNNLIITASDQISFGITGKGTLSGNSANALGGIATVVLRTSADAGVSGTLTVTANSGGLAGQVDVPLVCGYLCITTSTKTVTSLKYPDYPLDSVTVRILDRVDCGTGIQLDGISKTVKLEVKNHKGETITTYNEEALGGGVDFFGISLPGLGYYNLTATVGGLTITAGVRAIVQPGIGNTPSIKVRDKNNAAFIDIPVFNGINKEVAININLYADIAKNDQDLLDKIRAANEDAKNQKGMYFNETLMMETLCEFKPVNEANEEILDVLFEDNKALIRIPYSRMNDNGYIMGIPVASLKIFYLDEVNEKWVKQDDSLTDQSAGEVSLELSHLSVYCVMGIGEDLIISNLMNYPNPFSGDTEISFSVNMDAQMSASVYTISGRKIKALEKDKAITGGNVETTWNGRDENGNEAANGIYLYKVTVVKGAIKKEAIGKMIKMK